MLNIPTMDCGDGRIRADNAAAFPYPIPAKTSAYTVKAEETGKAFSNTGASGSVTFTLPAPKVGLRFTFIKTVTAQNIVLQMPAGVTINDGTAAKAFKNATSETGFKFCEVIGISSTQYMVNFTGTWVNDNT